MNKKEAIEIIKKNWPDSRYTMLQEALQTLIPELKESEDEKIIRTLKEIVNWGCAKNISVENNVELKDCLTWLEKQGEKTEPIEGFNTEFERQISHLIASTINKEYEYTEDFVKWTSDALLNYAKHGLEKQDEQNHSDKAEPKFKVGDWIVKQYVSSPYVIVDIKNNLYILNDIEGNKYEETIDFVHNRFHLWTIEDAEDGDVLAEHETIVLFKKIEVQNIRCYCTYHYLGFNPTFYVGTLQNKNPYCPATKEQRDLLFLEMKETGYEWDSEKKELKKISAQSSWSEEDEYNQAWLVEMLYGLEDEDKEYEKKCRKMAEWLKSIKDKAQPKQEWSEEDETRLTNIIIMLKEGASYHFMKEDITKAIKWLESLKPKSHWKPSEEQMEIIDMILTNESMDDNVARILRELKEQLEKL